MHLRQTNRSERNVAEAVVRPPWEDVHFASFSSYGVVDLGASQNGDRKPVFERFDESTSPRTLSKSVIAHHVSLTFVLEIKEC